MARASVIACSTGSASGSGEATSTRCSSTRVRAKWRNAAKEPVKNLDLWQGILAAAKPHEIEWRWVRGHAGDPMNERADALATVARDKAAGG